MNSFNGFKAEKATSNEPLPAGGYVAKIISAKVDQTSTNKEMLVIAFDVAEGEYKDFFTKQFKANTSDDKKFKGTFRLFVPTDDGSEKDEWSKRSFGNAMWAIEDSNSGYHWDWNEAALKGKTVGVIFRNKEWEFNGRTGMTTECGAFISASDIRNGTFKPLKDKLLAHTDVPKNDYAPIDSDDSDLPF